MAPPPKPISIQSYPPPPYFRPICTILSPFSAPIEVRKASSECQKGLIFSLKTNCGRIFIGLPIEAIWTKFIHFFLSEPPMDAFCRIPHSKNFKHNPGPSIHFQSWAKSIVWSRTELNAVDVSDLAYSFKCFTTIMAPPPKPISMQSYTPPLFLAYPHHFRSLFSPHVGQKDNYWMPKWLIFSLKI